MYVTYIGALSNAGIIFFASGAFDQYSLWNKLCGFMILEHILILGMFFIRLIIIDQPSTVHKGLLWSRRLAKEVGLEKKILPKEAVTVAEEDFILKYSDINYQE